MDKKALMIAYHFPPIKGSSGLQRTLSFTRYLPHDNWQPIILTVNKKAYRHTSNEQLDDVAEATVVHRAFALDTSRHLAIKNRYFQFMALPDPWVSWWLDGVLSGLKLIRKYRPQLIWSTYPVATAHLIGLTLQRITRLPWVADFRDPMVDGQYPDSVSVREANRWIEKTTISRCQYAVFTAPGAMEVYKKRYPFRDNNSFRLIENGYDHALFNDAESLAHIKNTDRQPLKIIHSGTIYREERDPTSFFDALALLRDKGLIDKKQVQFILRDSGDVDEYQALLNKRNIQDLVTLAPSLSYREALAEMLQSDALLVLQAASCNRQIPAKLYEYIRAKRPILALTDPAGNTAWVLRRAGIDSIAPLDSVEDIFNVLIKFVRMLKNNEAPTPDVKTIMNSSRSSRTTELSQLFDEVVDNSLKKRS